MTGDDGLALIQCIAQAVLDQLGGVGLAVIDRTTSDEFGWKEIQIRVISPPREAAERSKYLAKKQGASGPISINRYVDALGKFEMLTPIYPPVQPRPGADPTEMPAFLNSKSLVDIPLADAVSPSSICGYMKVAGVDAVAPESPAPEPAEDAPAKSWRDEPPML